MFGNNADRVGYATAPNDVWALGVILINLATGRNPWKQASLKDDAFRAYLTDPDFLLSILPISRELNRILKRIFCIDPMRRITLPELKEKIRNCKYFTRTAEVDRWEFNTLQQRATKKKPSATTKKTVAPVAELPPSPPSTPPCCSSSSSSSSSTTTPIATRPTSPAIWQQRIDPISEKQQQQKSVVTNSNNKKKTNTKNSILTTMLTTLMV